MEAHLNEVYGDTEYLFDYDRSVSRSKTYRIIDEEILSYIKRAMDDPNITDVNLFGNEWGYDEDTGRTVVPFHYTRRYVYPNNGESDLKFLPQGYATIIHSTHDIQLPHDVDLYRSTGGIFDFGWIEGLHSTLDPKADILSACPNLPRGIGFPIILRIQPKQNADRIGYQDVVFDVIEYNVICINYSADK